MTLPRKPHCLALDSYFCMTCGKPKTAMVEDGKEDRCLASPNCIGISHIIARRRFAPLLDKIVQRLEMPTDDPPRAA